MDEFIDTITRTSIFSGLAREDLARVAGKLDEIKVAAGTAIIRQAEPGDALYVVQAGAVEVLHRDPTGDVERIAILGPRECFGEIALLTGEPRSASVVALVDTSLLRMSKDACEQLVAQCPSFSLHMCRVLGQRLIERGRELVSSRIGRDVVLDDLFEAQPPTLRRLLLRASVLETVTLASLAAVVPDEPVDVDALAHLARRYPRLVQSSGDGVWTFHAGLRTFLLDRLTREERDGITGLHARAAAHFETRQDWARAADHYLGAGAWDGVVRVLERHGDAVLGEEPPQRFLARLDALSAATLRTGFHLVRLRAKAHALHGQTDAALRDCRELLTPAHASALGAIAAAFAYHVGLAELHRDKRDTAEAHRSLRDGLAVLEPSPARRAAPPILRLPRATAARRPWGLRRSWLYALAAVAAGAVVWHLPPPEPLDAIGMRFLATLTAAVVLWSINAFDDFVVALGLLLSWIVAGIVRPEIALSGFTKASWFLFVGALGLGAGVTRSGLLYRGALAMVRRVRPSYPRYTAILTVAGLLSTPALPSMISRMAVVAPVSWAIAESVGFAPRSPGAAGIVLAAFLGFSLLGFMFLTGSTGGLLGWNVLPEAARAEFGWTAWAVAAAPAGLVTLVGLWLAIHLLFRLEPGGRGVQVSPERFRAQAEILGAFTRREAFALAVLLAALAGWLTTPLHGVGEAWVALGALLAFVLGGVLDRASLRTGVDLGFLLFLGVVSGLSAVVSAVKVDRWLMTLVTPVLESAAFHAVSLLLAVALVTIVVRFVLNKFAATILLTLALTPLGQQFGVHPGVVLLVILLTVDVWFFPYQLDVYQIAYFGTGEQGFSHPQGRRFMLAKLAVSLLAIIVSVPWWRALGLIR